MKFLLLPFLIFMQIIILKRYKKEIIKYEEKRKSFVEYFKKINDYKTLKVIGEINSLGIEEKFETGNSLYVRWYFKKKYRETNDDYYKQYLEELRNFVKTEAPLLIPFWICIIIELLLVRSMLLLVIIGK